MTYQPIVYDEALKSGEIKLLKVIGNTYENADLLLPKR